MEKLSYKPVIPNLFFPSYKFNTVEKENIPGSHVILQACYTQKGQITPFGVINPRLVTINLNPLLFQIFYKC